MEKNLIIITKDSDFSSKIIIAEPPPKIIHLRIGNMKMKEMHSFLNRIWDKITENKIDNKLINVYKDRIECIN